MAWIIDFSSKNIVSQKVYQETVNQLVQSILKIRCASYIIWQEKMVCKTWIFLLVLQIFDVQIHTMRIRFRRPLLEHDIIDFESKLWLYVFYWKSLIFVVMSMMSL